MKRRDFMALLGGVTAAWPFAARAQQRPKLPTLGYLGSNSVVQTERTAAFMDRLRELGWVAGRTISIEYRWTEGRADLTGPLILELVRLAVDVIVTAGPSVRTAMEITSTIPIVFTISTDPVGSGFVASLARPGGNVTGQSYQGTDLAAKRIEILREGVPGIRRWAVMTYSGAPATLREMGEVQAAAEGLGMSSVSIEIDQAEQIAAAVTAAKDEADALYICANPLFNTYRKRIIAAALAARLPTMFGERENADQGGLMSYGPHVPDLYRRAAEQVDKILRGTKPSDIPVQQPTKFELVINLKTAKLLGIDISPSMLARADDVIE